MTKNKSLLQALFVTVCLTIAAITSVAQSLVNPAPFVIPALR